MPGGLTPFGIRARGANALLSGGGGAAAGAAQFQGAESLSALQGGALPTLSPTGGIDMVLTFWLAIDTLPAPGTFQDVFDCLGVAAGSGGWRLQINGTSGKLRWQTKDTGVLQPVVETVNPMPANEWLFCYFAFDNSGGAANIAIFVQDTSGAVVSNQLSGASFCGPVHTTPLKMGAGTDFGLRGRLSRVGIWIASPQPAPDATYLFNGGSGRTGAEVLASTPLQGEPATNRAYWDMNENTGAGTWPDSQALHDGTASGTLVAVTGPPTY